MFVNGVWEKGVRGETFQVLNPATGEVLADVADCNQEDARRAIEVAHASFPEWASLTAYERSRVLYKAHQLMLERREQLARVMTQEQGKPLRAALNEVGYGADFLLWYAEEAKRIYGETIPAPPSSGKCHANCPRTPNDANHPRGAREC